MKKFLVLAMCLTLFGCISAEEKAELKLEKEKALVLEDQNKCSNYGFSKGTDQIGCTHQRRFFISLI